MVFRYVPSSSEILGIWKQRRQWQAVFRYVCAFLFLNIVCMEAEKAVASGLKVFAFYLNIVCMGAEKAVASGLQVCLCLPLLKYCVYGGREGSGKWSSGMCLPLLKCCVYGSREGSGKWP